MYVSFVLIITLYCPIYASEKTYLNDLVVSLLEKSHFDSGQAPKVKIIYSTHYVAYYNSQSNIIYIEDITLQICRQLGQDSINGLSFILGHELSHFLKKNDHTTKGFALGDEKDHLSKDAESRADQQGLFLAEQAGFNASKVYQLLLNNIYKKYNLEGCNNDYPFLEERLRAAETVAMDIKRLHSIFNFANDLILLQEYQWAEKILNSIRTMYDGYEVRYNLALTMFLQAINYGQTNKIKYIIPLEPDYRFRMIKPESMRGEEDDSEWKILLQNASNLASDITCEIKHEKALLIQLYIALQKQDYVSVDQLLKNANQNSEQIKYFNAIVAGEKNNYFVELKKFKSKTKNGQLKLYTNAIISGKYKRPESTKFCSLLDFSYDITSPRIGQFHPSYWVANGEFGKRQLMHNKNDCLQIYTRKATKKLEPGFYKCSKYRVYVHSNGRYVFTLN